MTSIFAGLTPLSPGPVPAPPPLPASAFDIGSISSPITGINSPTPPDIGPQGTGLQPNDIADPGPDTMPNSWITFWDNIKYDKQKTCRDSNGIFDRSNCQIPGPMLSTYLAIKGKGYNIDGWAANYTPPNARQKFADDQDINKADRQLVLENIGSGSSGGSTGGFFGNGDFNPMMLSLMQSMFSGGGIDIGQLMMMGILFPDMFGDSFNIGGGMLDQCNGDTMCELMLAQLMQSIVGGFGGGGNNSFFRLG